MNTLNIFESHEVLFRSIYNFPHICIFHHKLHWWLKFLRHILCTIIFIFHSCILIGLNEHRISLLFFHTYLHIINILKDTLSIIHYLHILCNCQLLFLEPRIYFARETNHNMSYIKFLNMKHNINHCLGMSEQFLMK